MTNSTLDITQPLDSPRKLLRIVDTQEGETETKYAVGVIDLGGLVPKVFDYISLSYTGDNITGVVYKTGGSGGTTVATLALTYSGSNITSITRT